jgi:ligand-binding sensor domain-containing protein
LELSSLLKQQYSLHTTIYFKEGKQISETRNVLLLLVSLLSFLFANAQFDSPQPTFYNYSIAEGLPSSETYFVHQDKKGYIWICTDRGVVRYNGYKMRVFTEKDGLPDNVVFKIYEDYKGRLWFLTYNGLLSYWDGSRIVPYRYNNLVKKYLGGDITTYKSLSVDKNDNVLYSAEYKGIVSISASGKMKKIAYKPKNSLFFYPSGNDWLVSVPMIADQEIDIDVYQVKNGIPDFIKKIPHTYIFNGISIRNHSFLRMDDIVFHLVGSNIISKTIPNLIGLSVDPENIWYCTKNGVYKESIGNSGKNKRSKNYLPSNTVTSVCKDQEGGYWFSTIGKGVYYSPNMEITAYRNHFEDEFNIVLGTCKVKNEVFFSNKYGIYRLNNKLVVPNLNQKGQTRLDVYEEHLYESLTSFVPHNLPSNSKKGFTGYVDAFCNNESVLFASNDIVRWKFNGKSESLYFHISDKSVSAQHYFHAIMEDEKKRVFTGNNNGLFEVKNQLLYTHLFKDLRFKHRVSDLDYHPIWKGIAGTRGIGIYFFDNYKIIQQITTKEGLLDDQINSIFVDDSGIIWICSNKGLNRISKDQNGKITVKGMTMQNGLPSNEVNRVFAKNSEIWVATKNGLAHIPATYDWSIKRLKNQLSIDYLETKEQRVNDFKQLISFPAKLEYLKITLASSNFKTGKDKKIRYRYAHSDDWLYTTDGELILTKPASGDYELEISYLNEFGLWSKPEVMCRFSIDNPFYFKWYAVVLYIVLTALVVVFFFKRRIKQIQRKNQQQKNMQQLERKALQAQMNPHFIFNSLNSIQSFLLYEENEKAERYLLKFAQLIRQTLNNSRVSYITIEAEIDTLRKYLELEQMRFKDKFTFSISVQLQPDQMLLGIPPMLIQPFVENAVLHGFKSMQSGGEITVSFASLSTNRLMCVIQDNGIGREEAGKHNKKTTHPSFGTKITAERLFAYQQKNRDEFKIEIIDLKENGHPAGTKVIMWIPVVSAEEFDTEEI